MQSASASRFPRIRAALFEDYPQIANLCSRYLGQATSCFDEWQHRWTNNPIYGAVREKWPIGWLLENGQEIVGYMGNIPFLFELEGRKVITAVGCDWVVDASYRSYAALMADHFLNQEGAELVLSTTANADSYKVFSALGALRVPVGAWDRTALWITDYPGFAASWMKGRRLRATRTLSGLFASALFVRDKLTDSSLERYSNNIDVCSCIDFDNRFDVFWEELKDQNPNLLLAVRTKEALHWHFTLALTKKKLWIATITDGPRIIAYAIFLHKENVSSGMREVLWVDFQALERNVDCFLSILSWSLNKCRKERQRIHMLECTGLRIGNIDIDHLAPYIRKRSWWSYLYKTHNKVFAGVLANPKAWAPSSFEVDTTL